MTSGAPLGTRLPLGLSGLAIASVIVGGLDAGWVGAGQSHEVGMLILATAVPLQLIASLASLRAGDGPAASAMGVLAATWAMTGLTLLTAPPGSTSDALGLGQLAAAGLLAGQVVAIARSSPLVAGVVTLAAGRFAFAAVYELGGATALHRGAGALALLGAVLAGYTAVVFDLGRRPG